MLLGIPNALTCAEFQSEALFSLCCACWHKLEHHKEGKFENLQVQCIGFLNEFSGGHNSFSELTHVKRYPCGSRGLAGRSKSCSEWKHLKSDVCKVPRFVKTISLLPALLRPWTVQKQGAPFLAKIAQRRMLQCSSAFCGVGNFSGSESGPCTLMCLSMTVCPL